jgi:DNA-binding MarR family transcriptional regulator
MSTTTSLEFTRVLRDWSEAFMHRSMRDFVAFSKQSGLSVPQLSTLFRLYHHEACCVTDVGEHLGVTNAAASQMVDRLVQAGYLARAEDPADRRSKQLSLTLKGRALVEGGIEARHRWLESLTDALSPQDQATIIHALTVLTGELRIRD